MGGMTPAGDRRPGLAAASQVKARRMIGISDGRFTHFDALDQAQRLWLDA
jgi:hypothetical protein